MDYERVNWENLPSTKTPVKADNLNKMDAGIKDLETELSKKANSADVYTKTETDTKLDTKATQLADEISANKEEITALQTENSRLKGITNALPKISGEDTSLTLTNTANAPLSDIILKGNTSQNGEPTPATPQDIEVVTGNNTIKISNKNLLNGTHQTTITKNGITITSNSDDTFDITGISTSETSFGLITNIDQSNLVVGKTYYFYMSEKYNSTNLNVSIITQTPSLRYWGANVSTTIQEGQKYNNLILYVPKGVTMNYHNVKFMINEGSTAIDYVPNKQQVFPISLGSLELCKIGKYQDYFYKRGSKWYLHKEIGKKASYNGETITTSYISTTGELSTGAKVYYVVNSTDTEITDTTLISQLNALYNAYTYNDTTNISQTNANLPFIINAEAFKKIS